MNENQRQIPKALVLDMDGVLWRDRQPIGDLPAIFNKIRELGLQFVLATNNATLSVDDYVAKLRSLNVEVERWQVITSAEVTVHYLRSNFPEGSPIFIVGEDGLAQTLTDAGFQHTSNSPVAVVVGLDRHLSYEKAGLAVKWIRSGALFIGTNPDKTFPTPDGLMPGAGAYLAFFQTATEVEPLIMGKPQKEIYQVAFERLKTEPKEILAVGDRLDTDIFGAQAVGCQTALVLSGVTNYDTALNWQPKIDFIAANLTELLETLACRQENR